jgi:hypothetical protein
MARGEYYDDGNVKGDLGDGEDTEEEDDKKVGN